MGVEGREGKGRWVCFFTNLSNVGRICFVLNVKEFTPPIPYGIEMSET